VAEKYLSELNHVAAWHSKEIISEIMIRTNNKKFTNLQPDFCEDTDFSFTAEQKLWLAVIQQAFEDLRKQSERLIWAREENFARVATGKRLVNYNCYIFEIRTILHSLKSEWMKEVASIIEIGHDRILKKAMDQIKVVPFDVFDDTNNFKGLGLTPKKTR
jgi:hypothetical protein